MDGLLYAQIRPVAAPLLGLAAASQPRYQSHFAAMMAIQRLTTRETYTRWTNGWIPAERLLTTLEKIDKKHGVYAGSNQMWARKTKARIFISPYPVMTEHKGVAVYFVLLGSEGLPGETMHIVTDPEQPVLWVDRYQLAFDRTIGRRTWSMTSDTFNDYALRIADAVSKNKAQRLHAIAESLTKLPLTSGISRDARHLLKTAESSWNHRHRRSAGPSRHVFSAETYKKRIKARSGVPKKHYATHPNGEQQTLADLAEEAAASTRATPAPSKQGKLF